MFQKDPSRPGGGVFVATMKPKESQVEGVPEGTIISDEGHQGEAPAPAVSGVRARNDPALSLPSASSMPGYAWPSSIAGSSQHGQAQLAQQQQQQHPQPQGAQMVSYLPPDGSHSNVNPMLNDSYGSGNVQVLNVLDVPQASNNFMEQMMAAGGGILDGLPDGVGMFVEFSASFTSQQMCAFVLTVRQTSGTRTSSGSRHKQGNTSKT